MHAQITETDMLKQFWEMEEEKYSSKRSKEDKKRNEAVYLPHHAVVRNDKTTSKVRVVFNASSKNTLGISPNDTLMVGPKLQSDLRHIVLIWRVQPIVLVADIIKMYRQVKIVEEDTMFQRLIWRDSPEAELQDYELLTVTFGTASAPYLAVRALNQVSSDEGKDFPLASSRVEQAFYMDDLMTGCTSVEEGVEIYKQMTALLARGGFELQKWNSNSKKLLESLQKEGDREKEDREKGDREKGDREKGVKAAY